MNWIRKKLKKNPDRFLRNTSGVIHVGANTGQERELYDKLNLFVLWIEPIPEVFETLQANLRGFPRQRAIQRLVTDRDDEDYQFHIANNLLSSSILDLKHHQDVWPDVKYINTILVKSITLTSLLKREHIDPFNYQALIMDTQGSELLVLNGSIPVLHNFIYIKTEVANFESYAGCCQLADISLFMTQYGYKEFSRHKIAEKPKGGSYFDVIYQKKA